MKKKTSVTLSEEALKLLAELAERYAVSRSAMLEVIIRDRAKDEGTK